MELEMVTVMTPVGPQVDWGEGKGETKESI